jgi:ParB family chromosome partitioning protein
LTQERQPKEWKGRATVANALRLLSLDGELQGFIAKNLLRSATPESCWGWSDPAQRSLLARGA